MRGEKERERENSRILAITSSKESFPFLFIQFFGFPRVISCCPDHVDQRTDIKSQSFSRLLPRLLLKKEGQRKKTVRFLDFSFAFKFNTRRRKSEVQFSQHCKLSVPLDSSSYKPGRLNLSEKSFVVSC